jgi:hypothetical protein
MKNIIYDKKVYEKIKVIINEADPIGLIAAGAPDDEYENEIGKTLGLLQDNEGAGFSSDDLYKIFVDAFNAELAGKRELYDEMSEKIVKVLL